MTTAYLVLATAIFAILLAVLLGRREPECHAITPPGCVRSLHGTCDNSCHRDARDWWAE
jgi:hypothetical protein